VAQIDGFIACHKKDTESLYRGGGASAETEAEPRKGRPGMADVNSSLQEAMQIDGALGAALVDW
jgi:hypothetical protein